MIGGECSCGYRTPTEGLKYRLNSSGTAFEVIGAGIASGDIVIASVFKDITSNGVELPVTKIAKSAFYQESSITSVYIPNSVTVIEESAFYGCTNLVSVRCSQAITEISKATFRDCYSLESFEIPENVTIIREDAFRECSSLTSVDMSEKVTVIEKNAFYWCYDLESIVIPKGVTTLNEYTFHTCSSLKSVTFSSGSQLKTIAKGVFQACAKLTEIALPNGVTSIGNEAFSACSTLKTVILSESLNYIAYDAFTDCNRITYTKTKNLWYLGTADNSYFALIKVSTANNNITSTATIQEGCELIAERALSGAGNKYQFVLLPKTVKYINTNAFSSGSAITRVFYCGESQTDWNKMSISNGNQYLINAVRCFYSASQPVTSGNYWYYDNGSPKNWN